MRNLVVGAQNEGPSKRGEDVCNGMRIFLSKHIFLHTLYRFFSAVLNFLWPKLPYLRTKDVQEA